MIFFKYLNLKKQSRCLDVEDVDMYIHSRNWGETISTHVI